MTDAAFLRWLLALIQAAPDPFELEPTPRPVTEEAIEVDVDGQRFRIRVMEVPADA